jgi:hypothetical protein
MSAVEEIEAAIAKLTELREKSLSGPWEAWKQYNPLSGNIYGLEARDENVAKFYSPFEVELVEVLHRTIDAQIAILRGARLFKRHNVWSSTFYLEPCLALARAINGTTEGTVK